MDLYDEYKRLQDKKERLVDTRSKLSNYFSRKCKHQIQGAYTNPFLCRRCTIDFFLYLEKTNAEPNTWNKYSDNFKQADANFGGEISKELADIAAEKQKAIEKRLWWDEQVKKYGLELAKYIYPGYDLGKKELGKRYERFIGYLYEVQGYDVVYHGIKHGEEDRGIDIVAQSKQCIEIIQCKRWGQDKSIRENTITQLIGTFEVYKKENPSLIVECSLYSQNDNLDEQALSTLQLMNIKHVVRPYPFDAKKEYPLIKCNIGKDKSKIYHLPMDASYDRIKIEIKKGEFYAYTPSEAEAAGFVRAKN